MPWSDGLVAGSAAYAIASDTAKRVRVLAGPGTGKSYALKRRITRLLEEGVPPSRILAVTFTRMAAADLLKDIRSLDAKGADAVPARTLHSHCFRILAQARVMTLTGRNPRPLGQFELEPMLADLKEGIGGDKRALRKSIAAYEAAWARLQTDDPLISKTAGDIAFEAELVSWLTFHKAMLLGELVPLAYRYLRDNPLAAERKEFDHVVVDEYQDLNRAEQEVADLLAASGDLIVVGDDDQSIYTFKYAHRVGIVDFLTRHTGAAQHSVEECRRCPRFVVEMANALITHNASRPRPSRRMKVREENGNGKVDIWQFQSFSEEVLALAAEIRNIIDSGLAEAGQIIVLCQSRHLARPLFEELENSHVPVNFCYQESQLDEDGAAERISLLRYAADPADRVSLRHFLGCRSDTSLSAQWAKIREICEAEGVEPRRALEEMRTGARSATGASGLLARFKLLEEEAASLAPLTGKTLVTAWLGTDFDLFAELRETAEGVLVSKPDVTPAQLAEELTDQIEQPDAPKEVAAVRVMSLHKSKGLSAHVVIIMGCVEGVLPRQPEASATPAESRESIEESRRLFYVGITRVKAEPDSGRAGRLILSNSVSIPAAIAHRARVANAGTAGGYIRTQTSRFWSELGPAAPKPAAGPTGA